MNQTEFFSDTIVK